MAKQGGGVRGTRRGTLEGWKLAGPPAPRPSAYAQRVIDGGDYRFSELDARRAFIVANRNQRDQIARIWHEVASRLEPSEYQTKISQVEHVVAMAKEGYRR